jgi:hypothetical protein
MQPKKLFLLLMAVMFMTRISQAALGCTYSESVKAYGESGSKIPSLVGDTYSFNHQGFTIIVSYLNGKAEEIVFTALFAFSKSAVDAFLAAEAPSDVVWTSEPGYLSKDLSEGNFIGRENERIAYFSMLLSDRTELVIETLGYQQADQHAAH